MMFNTYPKPSNIQLSIEDSPYLLDQHGPVFVVGCPRSGTSFLSKCLGSLDDVESFDGGFCSPRMCHLLATEQDERLNRQLLATIRDAFWFALWQRRCFRYNRLLEWFKGQKGFRSNFGEPTLGRALFVYKEPFLCFPLQKFVSHFRSSKVIHIVRDGRDNADSLMRTYPNALSDRVLENDFLSLNNNSEIGIWRKGDRNNNVPWWVPPEREGAFVNGTQYDRFMLLWCEMTRRVLEVQATIPDRFLEVKYEDFVSEPMAWGQTIARFLGVPMCHRFRSNLHKAKKSSISISKANQPSEVILQATNTALPLLQTLGYES